MEGISFFLFFFLVVPFVLMNIAYRKERRKADEQLISLLKENNDLIKEFLVKKSDI